MPQKKTALHQLSTNAPPPADNSTPRAAFYPCAAPYHTSLATGTITLDGFQGVVFVGGFSYADVLDSAKGWAATIKFNPKVRRAGRPVPTSSVFFLLFCGAVCGPTVVGAATNLDDRRKPCSFFFRTGWAERIRRRVNPTVSSPARNRA